MASWFPYTRDAQNMVCGPVKSPELFHPDSGSDKYRHQAFRNESYSNLTVILCLLGQIINIWVSILFLFHLSSNSFLLYFFFKVSVHDGLEKKTNWTFTTDSLRSATPASSWRRKPQNGPVFPPMGDSILSDKPLGKYYVQGTLFGPMWGWGWAGSHEVTPTLLSQGVYTPYIWGHRKSQP